MPRARTPAAVGRQNRARGATYEREVAGLLRPLFPETKRRLGQARDMGHDLQGVPFVVECKRRRTLGPMVDWLNQAALATVEAEARGERVDGYCAIAKGDKGGGHVAILPWAFFERLLRQAYGIGRPGPVVEDYL